MGTQEKILTIDDRGGDDDDDGDDVENYDDDDDLAKVVCNTLKFIQGSKILFLSTIAKIFPCGSVTCWEIDQTANFQKIV